MMAAAGSSYQRNAAPTRVQAVAEMREAHAAKAAAVTIDRENAQVNEIMKLARKKGGDVLVMSKLGQIEDMARYKGLKEAEERYMDATKKLRETSRDKIICGALATWELAMTANGGLPPVCAVSGHTIAQIIDALTRAGYTSKGRINGADRAENREALMGKMHAEVHR